MACNPCSNRKRVHPAATHLLHDILPIRLLPSISTGVKLRFDLRFDLLPQLSYEFDIDIRFEQRGAHFLQESIYNLFVVYQVLYIKMKQRFRTLSSTTGALLREESAAFNLRPRSARTINSKCKFTLGAQNPAVPSRARLRKIHLNAKYKAGARRATVIVHLSF